MTDQDDVKSRGASSALYVTQDRHTSVVLESSFHQLNTSQALSHQPV